MKKAVRAVLAWCAAVTLLSLFAKGSLFALRGLVTAPQQLVGSEDARKVPTARALHEHEQQETLDDKKESKQSAEHEDSSHPIGAKGKDKDAKKDHWQGHGRKKTDDRKTDGSGSSRKSEGNTTGPKEDADDGKKTAVTDESDEQRSKGQGQKHKRTSDGSVEQATKTVGTDETLGVEHESGESSRVSVQTDGAEESSAVNFSTLQPFYSYAFSNTAKIAFTSAAFGFDVGLKRQEPPSWKTRTKSMMGALSRVVFTGFAINAYYVDMIKFQSLGGSLADLGLCWITSSNLASAIAIWFGMFQQCPSNLFQGLEPNYLNIKGIPLLPGQTKWLSWDKHLYALVLLPYILPALPMLHVGAFNTIIHIWWCWCSSVFAKACCCCCLWAVLAALSLGAWHYAKDEVQLYFYADMGWVLAVYFCIYMASSLTIFIVVPVLGMVFGRSPREGFDDVFVYAIDASSFMRKMNKEQNDLDRVSERATAALQEVFEALRPLQDLSDFKVLGAPVPQDEADAFTSSEFLIVNKIPQKVKMQFFIQAVDRSNDVFVHGQIVIITLLRMWRDHLYLSDALSTTIGERRITVFISSCVAAASLQVPVAADLFWKLL